MSGDCNEVAVCAIRRFKEDAIRMLLENLRLNT